MAGNHGMLDMKSLMLKGRWVADKQKLLYVIPHEIYYQFHITYITLYPIFHKIMCKIFYSYTIVYQCIILLNIADLVHGDLCTNVINLKN
jgi:hypothetical protein